jgi:hypothetical protein
MTKSLSNLLKTSSNILSANAGGTGLTSVGNTGNVLTSTGAGWVSSALPTYSLPTANTTTLGGVKVDGTTIVANNGIISANVSSGASATKTISNKTGAYTVVADDLGKIINCTANTFTVSLTAAATLGAGFTCSIWNTSTTATNAITISPASGTIDLRSTLILRCGEGLDIICDGTNWQTGSKKAMRSYSENVTSSTIYRPSATGAYGSVAIGSGCTASGSGSYAIGGYTEAQGAGSIALGGYYLASSPVFAYSNFSAAIGVNSAADGSVTASAGAMALGGSYASGTDSFAAAIGNNTSSFGATATSTVAIGNLSKATTQRAFALGKLCVSSGGFGSVALGESSTASGASSIAAGYSPTASGERSYALGAYSTASGSHSVALGSYVVASQYGKIAFGGGIAFVNFGDAQGGKLILGAVTSTTTAVVLTSDGVPSATAANQLIVASGQAMTFFGTLIAKQSASANMASYMFKGSIVNNGGTVSISSISIDTIVDTIGLGAVPTFTADNTNKGLAVTSGYKSATNIRWVCNIDSVEVTYA